jgi:hypothetical protein
VNGSSMKMLRSSTFFGAPIGAVVGAGLAAIQPGHRIGWAGRSCGRIAMLLVRQGGGSQRP